jgi:DNA-binding winged helix-turn-helix (wHTH) protein
MKIVIFTHDAEIINIFNRYTRAADPSKPTYKDSVLLQKETIELITARTEKAFFDLIADESIEGFAISVASSFSKKAIDFIKRRSSYVPILLYGNMKDLISIMGADIYIPFEESGDKEFSYQSLFDIIVRNVSNYTKNFGKLRKLMTKMAEVIEFDSCKYDPTRRMLFHQGKEVKKLSAKEGGILEILSVNFGQVVKRGIILEKVWKVDDYFSGRSMDVYVTHLRRLFQEYEINLTIKNISGIGLILEA